MGRGAPPRSRLPRFEVGVPASTQPREKDRAPRATAFCKRIFVFILVGPPHTGRSLQGRSMRGPIRAKRGRPSSTKFVLLHASLHGLVYSLRSATLGNGGGSHGEEGLWPVLSGRQGCRAPGGALDAGCGSGAASNFRARAQMTHRVPSRDELSVADPLSEANRRGLTLHHALRGCCGFRGRCGPGAPGRWQERPGPRSHPNGETRRGCPPASN